MATAAFRSTSRRSEVGGSADDAASSTRGGAGDRIRRARSLSRGPARFRNALPEASEMREIPKGRFLNKVSGDDELFETSLDDLADEFFRSRYDEEEDGRISRDREKEEEKARPRGRSVVSHGRDRRGDLLGEEGFPVNRVEKKGPFEKKHGSNGIGDGSLRRRRSLSVARHRRGDAEIDVNLSHGTNLRNFSNGKTHQTSTYKPAASNRTLRRSLSQKDLLQSQDSCSSHSALTDDEAKDIYPNRVYPEKMIWAVNAQKKSDKRKQDLLAALAAEEQRGQELTKIVKELLPDETAVTERPSQSIGKSNDRKMMSQHLIQEAEKYFADFLSNVEDTDLSSFDGERSETSSTVGAARQSQESRMHRTMAEEHVGLDKPTTRPGEADGLVFPWLQWEPCHDSFPSLLESKTPRPGMAGKNFTISTQEGISSRGSWSPEINDYSPAVSKEVFVDGSSHGTGRRRGSSFNVEEYLHLSHCEDLLFERVRQRSRIDSGCLLLCHTPLILM